MNAAPVNASAQTGRRAVGLLLLSATLWGLSWWPLKQFAAQGLAGAELALLAYGAVGLCGLPLLWRQRRACSGSAARVLALGLVGGSANVAFVTALVQGEVVRVMLLFYLSPVWSIVGARLFLAEAVGRRRLLAIGLALAGLAAVLGQGAVAGVGLDAADGLALFAGLAFAGNNLLARATPEVPMASKTAVVFVGGALAAVVLLSLQGHAAALPPLSVTLQALAYGFVWLGLAMVTWQYGVTHLQTARAAVILLTELVVAVASSVLLGQEPLTPRLLLGALLIGAAAWLEATDDAPAPAGRRVLKEYG